CIYDARIIRGAKAEPHQGQRVRTDDLRGGFHCLRARSILDRNKPQPRRGGWRRFRRRDPYVRALDAEPASQIGVQGIQLKIAAWVRIAPRLNADFRSVKLINILSLNFPILLGKSENLPLKC